MGTLMMMTSIVSAQECDPGICAKIPGTIYNKELDQCAWADEVPGCGAQALGYSTDCEGMSAHELKPVDFEFPDGLQENRNANQYFVVCVNQATEDDVCFTVRQGKSTDEWFVWLQMDHWF